MGALLVENSGQTYTTQVASKTKFMQNDEKGIYFLKNNIIWLNIIRQILVLAKLMLSQLLLSQLNVRPNNVK